MTQQYNQFIDTPVWRTVAAAIAELEKNKDLMITTAPEYVVGFLCQQLVVRRIVGATALEYDPQ